MFSCIVGRYFFISTTSLANDEIVASSVNNNDELSYFYCPSLPRVPLGEL